MRNLKLFLIGFLVLPFRSLLEIKENVWIFGADKGQRYSQNSKFLYEYILSNHKDIECYWITQSKDVYDDLNNNGYPVLYNTSLKGIIYSLTAKVVVYSTWFNDIVFTFPNSRRVFVYLMHGMPAKKIYYDHSKRIDQNLSLRIKARLYSFFISNQKLENMDMIPVTSNYFKQIVSNATRNKNIYIIGQPRTDAFFKYNISDLKKKYGFNDDDFIVTYMPTHRSYGLGKPSPCIFKYDNEAIDYFQNYKIKIVWKQHINMLLNYEEQLTTNCFIDFSKRSDVDSQELLFISDILITDYSSCFIDYMMLSKPIIFFFYDDYSASDNQLYITERDMAKIGMIAHSENDILSYIKLLREDYSFQTNYNNLLGYYYKDIDDNSCKRNVNVITDICKSKK